MVDYVLGDSTDEDDNEAHSNDFYQELLIDSLTDMNNKSILEMNAFKTFDANKIKSNRFEVEPEITSGFYKSFLQNRVNEIDAVINSHLRMTQNTETTLNQNEKLEILGKQQHLLRQKSEKLRFEALIQSFDLLHSTEFKGVRAI